MQRFVVKQGTTSNRFFIGLGFFCAQTQLRGERKMGRCVLRVALGLLLLLCCSVILWAAESEQKIGDVVVTAGRVAEPMNEVAQRIVIIDQEDIRLSTATSVDQLLAEQNVGHMHTYPGALTQVTMRGFRSDGASAGFSNPILFLMDGRRAGTANLAKIPVTLIERIEVIKGASSAVYGAEAMGGVVNIITKRGRGEQSASLFAEVGSASHFRLTAEVEGELRGLDYYAMFGRNDQRADYSDGDGDTYENTQSRGREKFVNLGYSVGQHRLGATVLEVDNWHVGNPGVMSHPDLDNYATKDLRSFDIRYDGANADLGLEWLVRYYQVDDRDITTFPAMSYGYRDANFYTDTQGAQVQLTWQTGISRLTMGLDWDEQEARNSQDPSGRPFGVNADYERRGLFIAEKLSLFSDRLLVDVGLRYDRYDVETHETQGYTTLKIDDEQMSEWCPRVGLVFKTTENLVFKASASRGVLLPTAGELAGDFINSGWYQDGNGVWQSYNVHYLGNGALDSEQSWTYEIGADYTAQNWYLNGSVFYADYEDKIETDNYFDVVLAESISSYKNIDGATVNGMELDFSCDLAPALNLGWSIEPFASLTYLFEFEDDKTGDDLLYVSDTQARFGVKTRSGSGFMAQLLGIYHGPQDVQNWNMYPATVEEMGGFTLWNLTLTRDIALPWRDGMELVLSAGIENILDKKYAYVKDYPMSGREYCFSAKLTF